MDSRRSWEVAAACCWINGFATLSLRSSAIIYVGILQTFDATREEASWPLSLMTVGYCLVGPIAGALASYITIPKLISLACLTSGLSVASCYFANGVTYLIVFLGFIQGCAFGFVCLCNTAISQHFYRYRTVASGIINAGFSIAGVAFPPLVQFLFDEYGCRGALLICGALMLNAVAGAFLTGSPPEPIVKTNYSSHKNGQEANVRDAFIVSCKRDDARLSGGSSSSHESLRNKTARSQQESTAPLVKNGTAVEVEETEPEHLHERYQAIVPEDEHPQAPHEESATAVYGATNASERNLESKGQKGMLEKLRFLLSPKFYLIAFSMTQIWFNMTVYLTIIVDFATDRNVPRWSAVFLVTCNTLADLAAKLGSGFITDRGLVTRSAMMATHLLIWAVVQGLVPLCTSYTCFVLTTVLMGWCNGAAYILTAVLFMELVDPDAFSMCIGVASLFAGLPQLGRPALVGYYRDTRGDYEGLFQLKGMLTACIGVLWMFTFCKERRNVRSPNTCEFGMLKQNVHWHTNISEVVPSVLSSASKRPLKDRMNNFERVLK